MTTSHISYKARFVLPDSTVEVRRFLIDQEKASEFGHLASTLSSLYPAFAENGFSVIYTDDEGEKVVISSDEELSIALTKTVSKNPYRLRIVFKENNASGQALLKTPQAAQGAVHKSVTCDVCEGSVRGFRYKCMECPDFDLCARCEVMAFHPKHMMVRIPVPSMIPPFECWKKGVAETLFSTLPRMGKCGQPDKRHGVHGCSEQAKHWGSCRKNDGTLGKTEKPSEEKKKEVSTEVLTKIGDGISDVLLRVLGLDVQIDLAPPSGEQSAPADVPQFPEQEQNSEEEEEKQNLDTTTEIYPTGNFREVPTGLVAGNSINSRTGNPMCFGSENGTLSPGLFGWTLVNSAERKKIESQEATGGTPSTGKPNSEEGTTSSAPSSEDLLEPRVARALERMLDMGFCNEGNWIGQLLMQKNADIDVVLQLLHPKNPRNQSRSANV